MIYHVEELCKLFALSEKRLSIVLIQSEDNRSLSQFRKNLVREITLHPIGKYGYDPRNHGIDIYIGKLHHHLMGGKELMRLSIIRVFKGSRKRMIKSLISKLLRACGY
jgi:hypothetical protein